MRPAALESRTQAAFEMFIIYRLGEITNDPVLQGTPADDLIGVCGNEDRGNRVARIDKMSVELDPSHSRHMNIGDQARGRVEERRCQEIGCRGERFHSIT